MLRTVLAAAWGVASAGDVADAVRDAVRDGVVERLPWLEHPLVRNPTVDGDLLLLHMQVGRSVGWSVEPRGPVEREGA